MSLFAEIRRRKVFQVAAAYVVVAWVLVQVTTAVEAPLLLPEWFDTAVIVFLAVGFPIALLMSWAFDLTPAGMVRDHGQQPGERTTSRKTEFVFVGLLVTAIVWIGFRELTSFGSSAEVLPNSVAVLPFEDLSLNPENAFFAPGIHDTLLAELSKIGDLNVIARSSVLRYADGLTPLSEIANKLNVATIMEGTVQFAEGQVRITAQLINPVTGAHLWSGNYDRNFADIFAIQSEIATRIAMALEAELLPEERERIETAPTRSAEALALYMQARNLPVLPGMSAVDRANMAAPLLDQATRIDPQFALAYAEKASQLAARGRGSVEGDSDWEETIRDAAQKAISIDPNVAAAHAALASLHHANWRWQEADQAYADALRLNPNDTDVLQAYATLKRDMGEYTDAIRLLQRAVSLDPDGDHLNQLGITYRYAQDYEAATQAHRDQLVSPSPGGQHLQLAFAEIARRNTDVGLEELRLAERLGLTGGFWRRTQVALAYRHLGLRDDVERMLGPLLSANDESEFSWSERAMAHIALGDYDRAQHNLEMALQNPGRESLVLLGQIKANDYGDPVLDEPEWRMLRARIGAL